MQITATQIEQWAGTNEARALLPILIRNLISATAPGKSLAMVGGDSVNSPGFDGELYGSDGNQWIPEGDSKWEMGCSKDVLKKANEDFNKRTKPAFEAQNLSQHFVFVTPRRWAGKAKWQINANQKLGWLSVSAIDADDLEAWLDASPSVGLWFADHIGLAGEGIESIEKLFIRWSRQSKIPVTRTALLTARQASVELLIKSLKDSDCSAVTIQADSREEGAAFVCAALMDNGLTLHAASVTQAVGLRFVEKNPQIKIIVAADAEVVEQHIATPGTIFINIVCQGDVPIRGGNHNGDLIVLSRPLAHDFEKALVVLGEDANDAARLARQTGRSWSVYQRTQSISLSHKKPAWLVPDYAYCLATIMLVGGWDSNNVTDRNFVQDLSGKDYESIEAQLLQLAQLNDSPVLHIGSVWKAKAPIDLLYLNMTSVTEAQINRFFEQTFTVFAKPNPIFELEPDQRFMAVIHKKTRGESGILLSGLADSIAKLGVYAEDIERPNAISLNNKVNALVQNLLMDADEQRWLSVSSFLRDFAEAAPDSFLSALESSLHQQQATVKALYVESLHDDLFGNTCWYANLLWALEALAWSSARLPRVVNVLALLCDFPIKQNQANAPFNTLVSLFRYWASQVSASANQKQIVLEKFTSKNQKIAWKLLLALLPSQHGWAIQNARPHWREDDAGQISDTAEAVQEYLNFIAQKTIALAENDCEKLAMLIAKTNSFTHAEVDVILQHAGKPNHFDDASREQLRTAMRVYLYEQNTYNQDGSKHSRYAAEKMMPVYLALEPADPVIANQWLFMDAWIQPAEGFKYDFDEKAEITHQRRTAALELIYSLLGLGGIDRLFEATKNVWLFGHTLTKSKLSEQNVLGWSWQRFVNDAMPHNHVLLSSVFSGYGSSAQQSFIDTSTLSSEELAAVLSCFYFDSEALSEIKKASAAVQTIFWQHFQYKSCSLTDDEQTFVVNSLMAVNRYCTAFALAQHRDYEFKKIKSEALMQLLMGVISVAEADAHLPNAHDIAQVFIRLNSEKEIPKDQLALMEFKLFNVLKHTEYPAKTLYDELLNHPDFFMQLICMCYKSSESVKSKPTNQSAVELAYAVLHRGRCIPGQQANQTINADTFTSWVNAVREQARGENCLQAVDVTIGQWFSACPADADGTWPCIVIRDFLELDDANVVRENFYVAVYNSRGATSHGAYEGGGQERVLEDKYNNLASRIELSHPNVASMLRDIAKSYRWNARRNDNDALLRMEH